MNVMQLHRMRKILTTILLTSFCSPALSEAFIAGLNAIDRNHYATAFRSFRPLAEEGNPEAQNNLGFLYQHGLGVKRNYSLALNWYTRSANQELAEAQHNLGMLNYLGHGVSQDFRIARRYFQKASDQKLGAASYMVGLIHFKGEGFQKNDAQARRYFAKAASEGDANGQYMYSYFLLTGEGKKRDQGSYWDNLFTQEVAMEELKASWVWAEIAVLNGQTDASNLAEFVRIQSDFSMEEIDPMIEACLSSSYQKCPFL